ncbi:DUF6299 family protein, partial [Streptomyces wedmorensis]
VRVPGTSGWLAPRAAPFFVRAPLVLGDHPAGIGGPPAVCDARDHTWVNTSVVKEPAYQAGAAQVRAHLMQLTTGEMGLPTPAFLASENSGVELS